MFRSILILVLLVLASCVPRVGASFATASPLVTAMNPRAAPSPTHAKFAKSLPVSAFPDATKVSSPIVPLQITPSHHTTPPNTPEGWKTFIRKEWNLAMNYPSDWSVREQPNLVRFRSPQGSTIQMELTEADSSISDAEQRDLPNTRCTLNTNAHGVILRNCLDTISRSYHAIFSLKASSGVPQVFSLTMKSNAGAVQVFDAMLASVRAAP